jgi:hypothetical protein
VALMASPVPQLPVEEDISLIRKVGVCILLLVFVASLIMCILFSLGSTVVNSQFWFGILGSIIGAVVGYLFGANSGG